MLVILEVVLGLAAVVAIALVVRTLAANYLGWRGKRVITCPENEEFAAVEVDAKHAASSSVLGERQLRLRDCSRWPEMQSCGQECLAQVEAAPEDCLARNLLVRWYEGSSCAVCGKPIGAIDWHTHKPALMNPGQRTLAWNEVRAEALPEVLATHFPVCWDCHVVESVVRKHGDQIVVRPEHRSPGISGSRSA